MKNLCRTGLAFAAPICLTLGLSACSGGSRHTAGASATPSTHTIQLSDYVSFDRSNFRDLTKVDAPQIPINNCANSTTGQYFFKVLDADGATDGTEITATADSAPARVEPAFFVCHYTATFTVASSARYKIERGSIYGEITGAFTNYDYRQASDLESAGWTWTIGSP